MIDTVRCGSARHQLKVRRMSSPSASCQCTRYRAGFRRGVPLFAIFPLPVKDCGAGRRLETCPTRRHQDVIRIRDETNWFELCIGQLHTYMHTKNMRPWTSHIYKPPFPTIEKVASVSVDTWHDHEGIINYMAYPCPHTHVVYVGTGLGWCWT